MRINKLLSNYGICSRKEARKLIEDKRIIVNGKLCIQGQWVEETDDILLDNEKLKPKKKVYIAFNKPRGITCTRSNEVENNIKDYLNYPDYIFPVGRLDKESEGLIILTNDGDMANSILESENMHEKEYLVKVDNEFDDDFLLKMSKGVKILNTVTRPCTLERVNEDSFKITLTQGLNRQIRRMCKAFGYNVVFLQRIRILNINLEGIEEGSWRYLTEEEVNFLKDKMNLYIDAHTHLDSFKENIDKAIEEINEKRIITIANSMDISSYEQNKKWGEKSEYIKPIFGIHPWKAGEFKDSLESLISYIEESPSIGEIGLDYVWAEDKESFPRQREIFKFILEEGAKRNKFMTIHTKGAEEEIYESLKALNYNNVIIHWYSGNLDTLQKFIDLGCYFTVSVDLSSSSLSRKILKMIPIDKLLLETDGPDSLEWINGEYGWPKEIINVYKKAAGLKGIELMKFKDIIQQNLLKIRLY